MSSSSSTATRTPKRVTFAVTPSPPTSSSCVICGNDEAKYRCPRCHERYCSLSCYKEHSEGRCSQGFYKDQVASYTEVSKPTEEERKNVEMMIYEHNQDDAPDDGGMEEEEVLNLYRLLDVLDDDGVMDDAQKELILAHLNDYLSPDQIDDFRRELKSGHLYKQVLEENAEGDDDGVVDWSPWWEDKIRSAERSYEISNEGRRRVPKHRCCHCYGNNDSSTPSSSSPILTIKEDIILYRISAVIYAYTKLTRQYFGDWSWDVARVGSEVLSLCPFLNGVDDAVSRIDYDNLRQMAITMNMYDEQSWRDVSSILDDERSDELLLSIIHEVRGMITRVFENSRKREVMALRLLESYIYYHVCCCSGREGARQVGEEGKKDEVIMLLKAEVDQIVRDLHYQKEETRMIEEKLSAAKEMNNNTLVVGMKSTDDGAVCHKLIQEIHKDDQ
ncbi:hypothetical protein FOZ60_008084 [Perkinsus olseni]|uniref:HIT-type domain-containing protein n=1 Tax=Perkinsus olseni TaxID=32597 RepID=A0A7J6NK64_PEROL|nr:hypothetical protein FOZ60_008084 [Perkinsus olseni]